MVGEWLCVRCDAPCSSRTRTGLCRKCYVAAISVGARPKARTCEACEKPISRHSKSGYCIPCSNKVRATTPEWREKHKAGIVRKFEDPAHKAKMQAVARRNGQKAAADPEHLTKLRERGYWLIANRLHTPEGKAASLAARARAGKAISEARLGWCPPEHRDHYRWLMRSKRMLAADAKAKIMALIDEQVLVKIASTHTSEAADYLRKYTMVKRLPDGTFQYGVTILTPAQIIERAQLRGWKPDRWAA
jgi:hypothetical protein